DAFEKRVVIGKSVGPIHAAQHVIIAIGPECLVIGRGPEPECVVIVGIGPEEGPGPERAGKARAGKERRIETMAGRRRVTEQARGLRACRGAAEGAARESGGAAVLLSADLRAVQGASACAGGLAPGRPRVDARAVQPASTVKSIVGARGDVRRAASRRMRARRGTRGKS